MPTVIRIALVGPRVAEPLEYGACLQGVVYRWLREIDEEIHDVPLTKPVTVGPLRQQGTDLFFEIAALVDGFETELLGQIARGEPEMVLQRGPERRVFEILQVSFRSVASWEDLFHGDGPPPIDFEFKLTSPTAVHGAGRLRRSIVLPAPELYFGSWLQRWNLCCPHSIPTELRDLAAEQMAVSFCQGGTQRVRMEKGRPFIGFEGRVRFVLLQPDTVAPKLRACLGALARFAAFCGTGVETMRGMGQTVYRG